MNFLQKSVLILHTISYIGLWANDVAPAKPRAIRVLSLDGGGVRGLMQAYILAKIEAQTQKPISELFDLVAGTSIGGITALALTVPDADGRAKYSALDMIKVFMEHGDEVFHRSFLYEFWTLGGLLGPKYQARGLENLLLHYFGDLKLSETLTNVLITGYYVDGQTGVEFASDEAKEFPLDRDCLIREVARATSAAPTFFDPATVRYPWGSLNNVVDGGLFANNPVVHAYVRAKKLFPGREIEVYSIGTGEITVENLSAELKGRGALRWMSPIIRHIQIGNSASDNDILYKLLNEGSKQNFFKLNISLNNEHKYMDDTSYNNLNYLTNKANILSKTNVFHNMLERLKY